MRLKVTILLISILLVCGEKESSEEVSVTDENEDTETDVFIPTHEWQTIKPGQVVPSGLHIRMNLETGLKEAKLNDPGETVDSTVLAIKQVEEALKNIASSEDIPAGEKKTSNPNLRSYEELKEDLGKMQLDVKSEFQVIDELMAKYLAKDITDEQKLTVLEDFEYYVHHFDNARHWVTVGGIHAVVLPSLNSSNEDVIAKAVYLLGSALQNNPKVQISAIEAGVMSELLRLLSFESNSVVKSRSLYALGGITRRFPLAQKKLVEEGGLTVFLKSFKKTDMESVKLQVKIITLLNDLVLEHQDAKIEAKVASKEESRQERLRQYKLVSLEEKLKQQGLCELIPLLLVNPNTDKRDERQDLVSAVTSDAPVRPEHDLVEKVLKAMLTFSRSCKPSFVDSLSVINKLHKKYSELSSHEVSENYYGSLTTICAKLKEEISGVKVEL